MIRSISYHLFQCHLVKLGRWKEEWMFGLLKNIFHTFLYVGGMEVLTLWEKRSENLIWDSEAEWSNVYHKSYMGFLKNREFSVTCFIKFRIVLSGISEHGANKFTFWEIISIYNKEPARTSTWDIVHNFSISISIFL